MVQFYTMSLLSFNFSLNFLKSSLTTPYVAFSFSLLDMPWEVKLILDFPQMFRFDPGSSIKLVSNKIEKMFPQIMQCDFTPAGHTITRADLKRINE